MGAPGEVRHSTLYWCITRELLVYNYKMTIETFHIILLSYSLQVSFNHEISLKCYNVNILPCLRWINTTIMLVVREKKRRNVGWWTSPGAPSNVDVIVWLLLLVLVKTKKYITQCSVTDHVCIIVPKSGYCLVCFQLCCIFLYTAWTQMKLQLVALNFV